MPHAGGEIRPQRRAQRAKRTGVLMADASHSMDKPAPQSASQCVPPFTHTGALPSARRPFTEPQSYFRASIEETDLSDTVYWSTNFADFSTGSCGKTKFIRARRVDHSFVQTPIFSVSPSSFTPHACKPRNVFHSGNGNCTIVFQLCFTTVG